jgi:hypothetical protein
MKKETDIKIFEDKKVRTLWDEEKEQWYLSIVDVIEILTGTDRPRKYWSDLKAKLEKEGSQLSEKIGQLKMEAPDGKMRLTDVADTEQLFRLIQSIPSPKAEPFKQWLAQVAWMKCTLLQYQPCGSGNPARTDPGEGQRRGAERRQCADPRIGSRPLPIYTRAGRIAECCQTQGCSI